MAASIITAPVEAASPAAPEVTVLVGGAAPSADGGVAGAGAGLGLGGDDGITTATGAGAAPQDGANALA